ncbi:MAG: DUF1343 domain-containing protein [Bacteroidales bacterium]|nr:DUF1343 domain-containing protein [Bacteroidales bacterium]
MFSFRTTSLEEQLDKALTEGLVGCFCTQNCWDTEKGRYVYDIFRERGNLKMIFSPRDTELTPQTNHIEFEMEQLKGLNALVVEIQDVGSRYFNYTKDVFRLMCMLKEMKEDAPSLYIVDHINPAGRVVEVTMTGAGAKEGMEVASELFVPKVVHRHGLTLGELANLYYSEIGAKFPLHVISALAKETNKQLLPWTIAPASDIPGLFTCDMYSGGGLWNNTTISAGIGTARPYEYIGAPFVKPGISEKVPGADGVMMRPCSFTPACGQYEGQKCYGYQIMLEPGAEYHSLIHTLQLIRYFMECYPDDFRLCEGFRAKLSDDTLYDYLIGNMDVHQMREHVKVEEQKWIRKAKKFMLYDDQPYRIK